MILLHVYDSNVFEENNQPFWEVKIPSRNVWAVFRDDGRPRITEGMKPEVEAWLLEHVGIRTNVRQIGTWRMVTPILDTSTTFYFDDKDAALFFKLVWG